MERPGSAIARQGALIAQKESYAHPRGQSMLQSSQVFFPSSPLKKPVAAAQPTSTSPRVTKGSQKPFNHKEVLDHMEKGGLFNGSGLIVSLFLHLTGFELG